MGNYVTKEEVMAEGVPPETLGTTVDNRIWKWEAIVEKLTRNIFREISPGELTFDGNNSRLLHFSLPLRSVTSLKINGETTALAADEYRAFVGIQYPQDDRGNPKIELTPIRASVYRTTPGMFVKGLDQLLDATWGYVDEDPENPGSYVTPAPVKASIIELVIMDLDGYFEQAQGGGSSQPLTAVRREKTDGHEIEYMESEKPTLRWQMIPASIAEVLWLYRAPWEIAAPEPIRFLADPGVNVLESEIYGYSVMSW
jgi:hypothetical protein